MTRAGGRKKDNSGTENVRSYVKKGGRRVKPHKRTRASKNKFDNFSTKGNVNPDTGKRGNVDPFIQG